MCGLSESMGTMAWCWEYQVTEVDSKHEVEQTVCRHSAFCLAQQGRCSSVSWLLRFACIVNNVKWMQRTINWRRGCEVLVVMCEGYWESIIPWDWRGDLLRLWRLFILERNQTNSIKHTKHESIVKHCMKNKHANCYSASKISSHKRFKNIDHYKALPCVWGTSNSKTITVYGKIDCRLGGQ